MTRFQKKMILWEKKLIEMTDLDTNVHFFFLFIKKAKYALFYLHHSLCALLIEMIMPRLCIFGELHGWISSSSTLF